MLAWCQLAACQPLAAACRPPALPARLPILGSSKYTNTLQSIPSAAALSSPMPSPLPSLAVSHSPAQPPCLAPTQPCAQAPCLAPTQPCAQPLPCLALQSPCQLPLPLQTHTQAIAPPQVTERAGMAASIRQLLARIADGEERSGRRGLARRALESVGWPVLVLPVHGITAKLAELSKGPALGRRVWRQGWWLSCHSL